MIVWLFIAIMWYPGGVQAGITVLQAKDRDECRAMERSFTVSSALADEDAPPWIKARPETSCQMVVRPSEDGPF